MPERETDVRQLLGRRVDYTPIAILINTQSVDAIRLLELAEQRRWRFINLGNTRGKIPLHITPRGALVDIPPSEAVVRNLLNRGIPTVRIGNHPHPDDAEVPAIVPGIVARGPLAVEHFADRDFKHVAYVGRHPWGDLEPMYNAFAARARELGCHCHLLQEDIEKLRSQVEPDAEMLPIRQEAFTRWLTQLPRPLGLFTFGDSAAALYCQWIIEAGLRVPQDVAVLGAGNNEFVCRSAAVPLSSIEYDHHEHIAAAMDLLARFIDGRKVPPITFLPPSGVVTRLSTDVLATSDPFVTEALHFMWDHVTEDLSVDQIATRVGVSRRTLERAFQRALGRGINAEFQRRRMEKARELLLQTDLQVAQIAEALSFSSSRQFCTVFGATYHQSPARYRRQHIDGQ